jgi:predicted PurR-regulated permease PerM
MAEVAPSSPTRSEIAAWVLTGLGLLAVLLLHLLPALLAGLLVYEVVHLTSPVLQTRLSRPRARMLVLTGLVVLVAGGVVGGVLAIVFYLRDPAHTGAILERLADSLNRARQTLPAGLARSLPENATELKRILIHSLETHTQAVQVAGASVGRVLVGVLLGLVIGGIVSLRRVHSEERRPLARALQERVERIAEAFRRVVFAQVRISAINAVLSAAFLLIALPLAGVNLPLRKSLVVLTFVVGLLPVVGNLISNTAVVIVALSHSVYLAVGCLVFLVVIHKLEYFLNAHIVGTRINAHAWEILVVMVVMESAFGIPGLIAAPIYYSYIKDELSSRQLI